MVSINNSEIGTVLDVKMNDKIIKATVVEKPFYDPKKKLASSITIRVFINHVNSKRLYFPILTSYYLNGSLS